MNHENCTENSCKTGPDSDCPKVVKNSSTSSFSDGFFPVIAEVLDNATDVVIYSGESIVDGIGTVAEGVGEVIGGILSGLSD